MNRSRVISILLVAVTPTFASALPADLAQAVGNFDVAQVHNDTRTLRSLVADDYLLVNWNATVENKEQYLADFDLPGFKIDPYTIEERVERVVYWQDLPQRLRHRWRHFTGL